MTRSFIGLLLGTASAVTLGFVHPLSEATPASTASPVVLTERISGPRPVARALQALSLQHGYVISYEDPMFGYAGDLEDITNQVRQDLDQFEKGKAPAVIGIKGGTLNLSALFESNAITQSDPLTAIQAILVAEKAAGIGATYKVDAIGDRYVVSPESVRDESGRWVSQASLLDTVISLPFEERTTAEMLRDICNAINRARGTHLTVGMGPTNLLVGTTATDGAEGQPARDVLIRALDATGRTLAWQLFYDPGLKWHALNIHGVRRKDVAPVQPVLEPQRKLPPQTNPMETKPKQ